jgi:predicted DNA-binding protein (MmcQ/YjbR family)
MFVALYLDPPHQLCFKCTPENFAELTEREGIIPAPYLARAMWVQESELGATLERPELALLLRSAYDLVVEKLAKSKRPGAVRARAVKKRAGTTKRALKRRAASRRR